MTSKHIAISALAFGGFATLASATTTLIPTPEGSYALWDTFVNDVAPGAGVVISHTTTPPGAVDTSKFSSQLSGSLTGGGYVTGAGDRLYNGAGASSVAYSLDIDSTATAAVTELTLILKMTPPDVSTGLTSQSFFNVSLEGTAATTSGFFWQTGESVGGGELGIVYYTWTGLSINSSDSFNISIDSPASGHVSVDAIQLSESIPEPSSAMLGAAAIGLALLRRRRA